MSDGELRPGVALFLRAFKDHPNETAVLSYPAPREKGRYHLAIWLGTWAEGDGSASERLNAMGWVYDPKAAQVIEARRAATTGAVHESAVRQDAPDTSEGA